MKEFLEFIVKSLVEKTDDVVVEEKIENGVQKFRLFVNEKETGKIIGKEGKTAKAIRTLLIAYASKSGKRCSLEIPDKKTE